MCTKHKLNEKELTEAKKVLRDKNCYPVFYTEEELKPYLRFYEGLIRPCMHNFIDPDDQDFSIKDRWYDFKEVNLKVAHYV